MHIICEAFVLKHFDDFSCIQIPIDFNTQTVTVIITINLSIKMSRLKHWNDPNLFSFFFSSFFWWCFCYLILFIIWKIWLTHFVFDRLTHFVRFQAILFYTPRWLWKSWEGGKIHALMLDLDIGICSEIEKRQKKKLLLDYLWDNLRWVWINCSISFCSKIQIVQLNNQFGISFSQYIHLDTTIGGHIDITCANCWRYSM